MSGGRLYSLMSGADEEMLRDDLPKLVVPTQRVLAV